MIRELHQILNKLADKNIEKEKAYRDIFSCMDESHICNPSTLDLTEEEIKVLQHIKKKS